VIEKQTRGRHVDCQSERYVIYFLFKYKIKRKPSKHSFQAVAWLIFFLVGQASSPKPVFLTIFLALDLLFSSFNQLFYFKKLFQLQKYPVTS